MQHADNLIQDDAKVLVEQPFFNPRAAQLAQPVVPLADIQSENYVHVPVYAQPAEVRLGAGTSYVSLAVILLFLIVALAGGAAFYYFPAQNKTTASEVSQQAIDDNIDDSVKRKTSISQKTVEAPPNQKTLSSALPDKNKSVKQTELTAPDTPRLTPDETEPGQWISEDAVNIEEDKAKPKTKKRREKKADDELENFVREVENVERQTRRIKKVLNNFGDD